MADVLEHDNLKVAIVYNPFNPREIERHELVYNPDFTLSDYMEGLPEGVSFVAGHNGDVIEKDQWGEIKFEPGEAFSLVVVPEGGGGGKNIFRLVAMIALVAASAWGGPLLAGALGFTSATAGAVAGAFIGIAGSMLVNAILPAPSVGGISSTNQTSPSTYGFDGPKNTSQEGVVVPVTYGTFRQGGNIVDLFTVNEGDDQYLYMRTILNDGRCDAITDILLNDEDIANFANVETRVTLGEDDGTSNDWFGEAVTQWSDGRKIGTSFLTYTTRADVEKVRLSLLWPSGLVNINDKDGSYQDATVGLVAQIKPHDADGSAWEALDAISITRKAFMTSGLAVVPGYGAAPAVTAQGDYAFSYGNILDQLTGEIIPGVTYDLPGIYVDTDTNPTTGDAQNMVVIPAGSGLQSITVDCIGEILTDAIDAVTGTYHLKAVYRKVGADHWTVFGEDLGTVSRFRGAAGAADMPVVARTWSTVVPSDAIEVAVLGGFPTQLTVSAGNTGSTSSYNVTRKQTSAVRYDIASKTLPLGKYDIRIQRTLPESTVSTKTDAVYLQDVSEITLDNMQYPGTATLSLKIKMNDQLSSAPKMTALVKGSHVKQFDEEGNVLDESWSPWPCWATTDILMNEDRGRGLSASKIDFPAFKEWEAYCIEKNLQFNMIFDTDSNVWDATQIACRVGHAALSRIGTRWSVVVDKPSEAVMVFNEANIIKGTFQTDWLPLSDRANEIVYTFFDKENANTQTTIRVTDPLAPNTGAGLRIAQVTGYGVDNISQAQFDVEKQIRENRLLRKTVTFDAPLEAVGLSHGDVAIIQHSSANYGRGIGGGRLKTGNTTTTLKLDAPVTMTEGVTYSVLVNHAALKRYDVTIGSISDALYVTGLPDEIARVSRIVQGGTDAPIYDVVDAGSSDRIIVDDTSGFAPGPAELWVTDVAEERTVIYAAGPQTQITVTEAFSVAPADYTVWMLGPFETVKQKFRLRTIAGSDILQRKLTFTEYNELVYSPLGTVVTPSAPPVRGPVAQAQGLFYSYPETFIGYAGPVRVQFQWQPGDTQDYGGADIYLALDNGPFQYIRSVQDVTAVEQIINVGQEFRLRVVEFNKSGARANVYYAPVVAGTVKTTAVTLDPPSNLKISLADWLIQATVLVGWDASTSAPLDGYLVEYTSITKDQYTAFNAGTWTPPDNTDWSIAGLAQGLSQKIVQNNVGYILVRVRSVYGESFSEWISHAYFLDAPAIPNRVTGLTLENADGDTLSNHFTGKDAKFSWRDVAALAASLNSEGADTSGLDYTWRDYEVRILSPEGNVLRRETTVSPYYIYTFEKNVDDNKTLYKNGHARREFTIEVRMRGRQGQISDPAWMDVSNPAPDVIPGTVSASGTSLQVDVTTPADPDYVGLLVWASTDSGFEPSDETQVWIGPGKPIFFVPAGDAYYVRWAGYDAFGTDELNVSPAHEITAPGITAEDIAHEILDRLDLIDGNAPGSVNARIAVEAQNRATDLLAEAVARASDISDVQTQLDAVVAAANGAAAGIITEQTARIDADGALGTRIDAVVAQANGNTASITSEATARAGADGALSDRIDAVVATANGAAASVISEATARASADGSLSSRIDAVVATANGNVSAISTEVTARTNADSSLSSRIDAVVATAGSNAAAISTEATARASGDSANASSISAVSSTVDGHTATISSYGTSINGLLAKAGVTLDVNGHITGWSLNNNGSSGDMIIRADHFAITDSSGSTAYPFEVISGTTYIKSAVIRNLSFGQIGDSTFNNVMTIGSGRIVFDNGTYMKVQGVGFGSSNQFIEWYGPKMALSSCTETNGIAWLKTNGSAYFGGALSAGTLTTSAQTSDTSASAVAETAVFGSNGHTITVTMSFSYSSTITRTYAATSTGLSQYNSEKSSVGAGSDNYTGSDPGATTVDLYRSEAGGAYVKVATLSVTGSWNFNGTPPVVGDTSGQAIETDNIVGSITYTDPANNTNNRQYKAVVNTRTTKFLNTVTQRVSVVCVEP